MDSKTEKALKFINDKIRKHNFDNMIALTSFGKDSLVIMSLIRHEHPDFKFLWIKPPYLPESILNLAKELQTAWNLNLDIEESKHLKDKSFMENVVEKPNLPKTNPENCCSIFKVEPMMRYCQEHNVKAWFSGLRSTESEKRRIYTDEWKQGEFVKYHPILDWTEWEIWRYIACHNLPVAKEYCEGYRSLGCKPCSFVGTTKGAEREGRWADTALIGLGCGIHCVCPLGNEEEMKKALRESHEV